MNYRNLLLSTVAMLTLGSAIAANEGDEALKALQSAAKSTAAQAPKTPQASVAKAVETPNPSVSNQTIAQMISTSATAVPAGVAK